MENDDTLDENINWNHAGYMLGKLTDVIMVLVMGEGDARSRLRDAIPYLQKVIPGMLPSECDIRGRVERAYKNLDETYELHPSSLQDKKVPRQIKNCTGAKIINELFGAWMDLRYLVHNHLGC
jgi:cellobiose-specific phosphotransferase system component IIA